MSFPHSALGGIVHLSRAAVVAPTVSASVSLHLDSLALGIDSMNRSYCKTTQQTRFEATLMQLFGGGQLILIPFGYADAAMHHIQQKLLL